MNSIIIDSEKNILPNYSKSVVNLSSSIANAYGNNLKAESLKMLDQKNLASKKNIILIILDGFGYNLFANNYSNNLPFLRERLLGKITSVFPSTTAAAMNSIYTGMAPLEHGVMGWTLYFKEYFRMISYLPTQDASSNKKLSDKEYDFYKILKPSVFLRKLNDATVSYLSPKYISGTPYNSLISGGIKSYPYKTEKSMLKKIHRILKKNSTTRNFVMAYSVNPDSMEHKLGTDAKEIKNFIKNMDKELNNFYANLEPDTAVLITADHGLTDIDEFIIVNDDKELYDSLILPTFPESRFVSFFVKPHKIDQFKHAFEKYKDDFLLLTRDEFLSYGFLGDGKQHPKLDDFIGNYLAIAIGKKAFRTTYRQNKQKFTDFKAHHSGITKDEMEVPLFYFEK